MSGVSQNQKHGDVVLTYRYTELNWRSLRRPFGVYVFPAMMAFPLSHVVALLVDSPTYRIHFGGAYLSAYVSLALFLWWLLYGQFRGQGKLILGSDSFSFRKIAQLGDSRLKVKANQMVDVKYTDLLYVGVYLEAENATLDHSLCYIQLNEGCHDRNTLNVPNIVLGFLNHLPKRRDLSIRSRLFY